MSKQDERSSSPDGAALTRRHFLSGSAAAVAAAVAVAPMAAQQTLPARPAGIPVTSPDHHLPNPLSQSLRGDLVQVLPSVDR